MAKNIETRYGKFSTLTEYENYWKGLVGQAYSSGFEDGLVTGWKTKS